MTDEENRSLDSRIAERVFGLLEIGYYRRISMYKPGFIPCDPSDFTPDKPEWTAKLYHRFGPHRFYIEVPHYTTNAEASKQLRAKLAETYWQLNLVFPGRFLFALLEKGAPTHPFGAEADTEERAVALCALKSVE